MNCEIRICHFLYMIGLVAALHETKSLLLVPISMMSETVVGFKLVKIKFF